MTPQQQPTPEQALQALNVLDQLLSDVVRLGSTQAGLTRGEQVGIQQAVGTIRKVLEVKQGRDREGADTSKSPNAEKSKSPNGEVKQSRDREGADGRGKRVGGK